MGRDASLDDFVTDDREATDDAGDAATGESDDETAAADDAVASYAWSPDGAACASCGESAERRWRDDPGLVCEECKDW